MHEPYKSRLSCMQSSMVCAPNLHSCARIILHVCALLVNTCTRTQVWYRHARLYTYEKHAHIHTYSVRACNFAVFVHCLCACVLYVSCNHTAYAHMLLLSVVMCVCVCVCPVCIMHTILDKHALHMRVRFSCLWSMFVCLMYLMYIIIGCTRMLLYDSVHCEHAHMHDWKTS
jgi:hypothetical protein